ncbi:MAG: carboxypeptidase regulatory-like domain-containing protein, partial [Ginsengibacter sp.]
MKKILFAILLFMVSAITFAQETTSEIQGIITDEDNSPLSGATIMAIHIPTGTKYSTTSRKEGRYNLPNLKVGGPYTIIVTYVGYKPETQDNVTLLLGQVFNANVTMIAESKQLQQVVVTSRLDRVFNNNRTGSQEVVSRTQLERLPTLNRSFQDFTRLTPSANGQSTVSSSPSQSLGGRNGLYNNITVDGANFNNVFGLAGSLGGQTNSQPISLDAIEQIQVSISPYDVKQGGFSGAGVNSVTRSGTNQFKGSIYTYLRNPDLQGYHINTKTIPKPSFKYNQRGATIGGPIIKDKVFFFLSGEQERISQPATTLTAIKPGQTAVPGVTSQAVADTLDAI